MALSEKKRPGKRLLVGVMPSWISHAQFKQYIMKCNTHQVSVLYSITYAFEDFSNTFWWLTHDYDSWAHIVWSLKSLKLLTTVSQNCYIKSMDAIRWWFKEAICNFGRFGDLETSLGETCYCNYYRAHFATKDMLHFLLYAD